MKRWSWIAVALAVALAAPRARADTASEAQLQFELGAELYKQKRYTEALERFIASHRLVPNANVVLNIVQTFEFLGRKIDAYNWNETHLALEKNGATRSKSLERRERLAKDVAVVEVRTTPSGAELYVDREDLGSKGVAPRRLAVEPGTRRILARLPQHDDASREVDVKVGEAREVELTLAPHRGKLVVETRPAGAEVRLDRDGRELGKTPISLELPVGEQRISVSLAGYQEAGKTVQITRSGEARVTIDLARVAGTTSVLTVRGNVAGAGVWIDGRLTGTTPLMLPSVDPGRRQIEIKADGRESWSGPLLLEPGSATRVDYDLVDPRERPWSGWRWVGYGTGATLFAAGAVTGLIARGTRSDFEREPSSATLDRLHAQNTAADVLMAAGVVTVGVTALWDLVLSGPEPASKGRVSIER